MNLYDAIFLRRTVKGYTDEEIEQEELEKLLKFANSLTMLDKSFKVKYKIICNLRKNDVQHTAGYAPYYLIIMSDTDEDSLVNSGYLMGQISLYMTSKGIGTNSLLNTKYKERLIKHTGQKYFAILAFGKAKHDLYRNSAKAKRLSIKNICTYKEKPKKSIQRMLEAARMAPSNMNSQPWHFVVYENRIHVFCRIGKTVLGYDNRSKMIDVGMMISYLVVAAEEEWNDVHFIKLDNIVDMEMKENKYILTAVCKEFDAW